MTSRESSGIDWPRYPLETRRNVARSANQWDSCNSGSNPALHQATPGVRPCAIGLAKIMVEMDGIEPTTLCLQSRRSPS